MVIGTMAAGIVQRIIIAGMARQILIRYLMYSRHSIGSGTHGIINKQNWADANCTMKP